MNTLQEIKERAAKATEGPWEWSGDYARHVLAGKSGPVFSCGALLWPSTEDAEFIASARTDIPKLVAAFEAMEVALADLDKTFDGPEDADKAIRVISETLRRLMRNALA